MLNISGLRAGYGRLNALRGIELKVEKSEIALTPGPSGAGKSTLLKVICGLRKPWEGRIECENASVNCQLPQSAARILELTGHVNIRRDGEIVLAKRTADIDDAKTPEEACFGTIA